MQRQLLHWSSSPASTAGCVIVVPSHLQSPGQLAVSKVFTGFRANSELRRSSSSSRSPVKREMARVRHPCLTPVFT